MPIATASTPVSITLFTASPATIRPGESITVEWQATTDDLTLWQLDDFGRLGKWYSVPAAGSMVFTTTTSTRNPVAFMLFASTGQPDQYIQAYTAVPVLCLNSWFFVHSPSSCPSRPAVIGRGVAEHFEHGMMIWVEWQKGIYVLYSDGRIPAWSYRQDDFQEGMPDSDPSLTPPAGLYAPARGFGRAWLNLNRLPGDIPRDRLGWATDREFEMSSAFQCEIAPNNSLCYLEGSNAQVIVLQPDQSGWTIWTGPDTTP